MPRVYLKTHDVTGSEGFLRCARHFFAGILDVFQGKMTRRTAKRPAVRVRWEFSDTPYKRPGERLSLRAMLPLAKGVLGSMTPKALFRFAKIMAKGEPGLDKRFDREKRPCLFVGQQGRTTLSARSKSARHPQRGRRAGAYFSL